MHKIHESENLGIKKGNQMEIEALKLKKYIKIMTNKTIMNKNG